MQSILIKIFPLLTKIFPHLDSKLKNREILRFLRRRFCSFRKMRNFLLKTVPLLCMQSLLIKIFPVFDDIFPHFSQTLKNRTQKLRFLTMRFRFSKNWEIFSIKLYRCYKWNQYWSKYFNFWPIYFLILTQNLKKNKYRAFAWAFLHFRKIEVFFS